MASNQTEHYGLSQWALTDDVRMEDFNSDNAKIDAALADKYGSDKPLYAAGSYTGTGEVDVEQQIDVGFCPSAVIVICGMRFGLAIRSDDETLCVAPTYSGNNNTLGFAYYGLSIYDNGFSIVRKYNTQTATLNDASTKYHYIAFR